MTARRNIAEKSTGQLVDELVTNAFKTTFAAGKGLTAAEYEERYQRLRAVLIDRLGADLAATIHDLAVVSLATWHAQEVVMHETRDDAVAAAGRQAQRTNALRTGLIREIDRLLGEAEISITTKTYG